MQHRLGLIALVLLLIVISCLLLINFLLLPRLDTMLIGAVRRELSLPADATVVVGRGSLQQTMQGFLPRFHAESPTAVIDDLPVELVSFTAMDVDFNMRQIITGEKAEITAVGSADTMLRVSTEQLKARLVPLFEQEGLRQVEVEFGEGSVKVTAKRKLKLIGSVKLAAKGQFIVDGSDVVRLKITDFETGQINIGVGQLGLVFDESLPILDLGGMFAKIVIDELQITGSYLQVTAHMRNVDGGIAGGDTVDVF